MSFFILLLSSISVRYITAEIVALTLFEDWIARFGSPLYATTDQGRQFESLLFQLLLYKNDVTKIRIVHERWHRTLKASIMAIEGSDELSLVFDQMITSLRLRHRPFTKTSFWFLFSGFNLKSWKLTMRNLCSNFNVPCCQFLFFQLKISSQHQTFVHNNLHLCKHN